MATTVSLSGIRSGFSWSISKSTSFGTDTSNAGAFAFNTSLANGTGASSVNKFHADEITIAAGASTNIDLAGVLSDIFGATLTFSKVRLLYIEVYNSETSTGSAISVGGDTNGFSSFFGDVTDKIKIRNGGCLQLVAVDATAYGVTASTGDILKITNLDSENPVVVRLAIAGE
jgi:hypothetical protein